MLLVVGCLLFVESAGWVLPTFHFVIYCFPLVGCWLPALPFDDPQGPRSRSVGCWFLVHCYSEKRYNFINYPLSTIHSSGISINNAISPPD